VEAAFDPDPPRGGANVLWLRTGRQETPEVEATMPEMGAMPEMRAAATVEPAGDGQWKARFRLPMGGGWTLVVRSGADEARFAFTVGAPGLVGEATESGHVGHTPLDGEGPAAGAIRIDDARRQQFNIRVEPVVRGPLVIDVYGSGSIVPVEGRTASIALRTEGYARDVRVETGELVAKGQVLLSLYAPGLIVAQQDLRIAIGTNDPTLVQAVRDRLRRMDVGDTEIAAIERGTTYEAVPIRSPVSGHILEKHVVDGDPILADAPLFVVAALDRVWVEAELYEPDASRIVVGAMARVSFPERDGREQEGRVELLHPHLMPAARTRIVRVGLDNDDHDLVPGMWATVHVAVDLGEALLIPESAVLYTGERRIVFVDLGDGRLAPREIHVGARSDGRIAVRDGLAEGDRVVSSGTFLVAAESRVRSAADAWSGDGGP
jgi:Cu(I)/Ag(I) efflux system membrane fusion protein